ncbi:TatD family hydrolase [Labilibaculum sp. K2S]|uniref:Qat anti-phage system TatD family nuclease QatD n=1 Tax=Labilibaculum sp. K2S TaxID=3056386 RepID=UPI0025A3361E|nr:Qat anti-phage system TatD family nuclease QatD [Labilibaculum sp. K2S]MDM8161340.1 TatD family hydrolase [Labilibaculum sp. K2S]
MIIDTHCHFDMFDIPLQIVQECEKQKIITIGMTNLPSHFEMGFRHVRKFKYIRLALGLHPLMAKSHASELINFKNNVDKTSYIGEVGLDFSKEGIATKQIQLKSFEYVLNTIKDQKKILSIHSRNAEKEVLDLLVAHKVKNAIFHWYSGNLDVLQRILKNGFYFSVNPSMIKSKSGEKIISDIPLDRILTETDSPFTSHNGRKTKPIDVKLVISYLSNHYKLSENMIENQIYTNFKTILNKIR